MPDISDVIESLAQRVDRMATDIVRLQNKAIQPKHNLNATGTPSVNDDENDGFGIGSVWADQSASPANMYLCNRATAGAASWKLVSPSSGGLVTSVNGADGDVLLDSDDIPEGAINLYMTTTERDKIADSVLYTTQSETTGRKLQARSNIGFSTGVAEAAAAASAATVADGDTFPFTDVSASSVLAKITWANIKAAIQTALSGLYVTLTGAQTVAGEKTWSDDALFNGITTTDALNVDGTLTSNAQTYALGGFNAGYSRATSVLQTRSGAILFPRFGDLDQVLMQDYQDGFAYLEQRYDSMVITPAPDGTIGAMGVDSLFYDDSTYLYWNTGTPFPIEIEIDLSTNPIQNFGNGNVQLAITFRSSGVTVTNIKIEFWNGASYDTMHDAAPGVNGYTTSGFGQFISPNLLMPAGLGYTLPKIRVTINGDNAAIANNFRLQRLILYQANAPWNPWHVRLDGGTMHGNLNVPTEAYGAGWYGSAQVPTKGDLFDLLAVLTNKAVPMPFHAESDGTITLTNMSSSLQFLQNNPSNTMLCNLVGYTQCRLVARVRVASTSANNPRFIASYKTGSVTTSAGDYSDLGTSEVAASLGTIGFGDSDWIDIDSSALAGDVVVACLQQGGDGAADPQYGMVTLWFR